MSLLFSFIMSAFTKPVQFKIKSSAPTKLVGLSCPVFCRGGRGSQTWKWPAEGYIAWVRVWSGLRCSRPREPPLHPGHWLSLADGERARHFTGELRGSMPSWGRGESAFGKAWTWGTQSAFLCCLQPLTLPSSNSAHTCWGSWKIRSYHFARSHTGCWEHRNLNVL